MAHAPVEDWQVESLVIVDCYKRNLQKFTFYNAHAKIKLTQTEAYAINSLFGATSTNYNTFIRQLIEPKLIPSCKMLEPLK